MATRTEALRVFRRIVENLKPCEQPNSSCKAPVFRFRISKQRRIVLRFIFLCSL
jgi:hypothetical protein